LTGATLGRLVSINVSAGGVPKLPVTECRISLHGLAGDRQRDLRFHGGPDRAVSLFSLEQIQALQAEGHPIVAGSIGENLTLSGLGWGLVVPGARLRIGEVLLELTRYAAPCRNIAGSFVDGNMNRVSAKLHPGWSRLYARVIDEGLLRVGDPVALT
jgi:MOSC domain-containing protein YiiM